MTTEKDPKRKKEDDDPDFVDPTDDDPNEPADDAGDSDDDDADDDEDEDEEGDEKDSDEEPGEEEEEDADAGRKPEKKGKGKGPAISALRKATKKSQREFATERRVIDRLAKLAGIDRATLLAKLDEAERGGGVDAATVGKDGKVDATQLLAAQGARMGRQALLELEADRLAAKSFYGTLGKARIRRETLEHALANGVSVKEAYMSLYGDERLEAHEKEIEQRVLAGKDRHGAMRSESGDGGVGKPTRSNMDPEMRNFAERSGFNSREYEQYRDMDFDTAMKIGKRKKEGR